jgi:hypothetical protein
MNVHVNFFGEWQRWWDLVSTKSLLARVAAGNPVEAGANIQPFHVPGRYRRMKLIV